MKILGTITESDFPNLVPIHQDQYGELRKAVRVVLLDEGKNVALIYYPPKNDHPRGEYSLPGGGVGEEEDVLAALRREVIEETGCHIKNIEEIGIVKERGVGKTVKHDQDSYCFRAEVEGIKGMPEFTERERGDFIEVRWLPVERAIAEISHQEASFHRTRDLICLRYNMTKDFGYVFWLHLVLIVAALSSPFWLSWKLILVGIIILHIQWFALGGCYLTHIETNKDPQSTFYYHYLSKIFSKINKKYTRFIVRYVLPVLILGLALVVQI